MLTPKLLCGTVIVLMLLPALIVMPSGQAQVSAAFHTAPYACFQATPPIGGSTAQFQVDASCSRDDETPASTLQVRWDWEADGVWDTDFAFEKAAATTYATCGPKTIQLEVRDATQQTNSTTRNVTVNCKPTLRYAGTSGYEVDGVDPSAGTPTTVFRFKVVYQDVDGTEPAYVRIRFAGEAQPTPMIRGIGSPATGTLYEYNRTFYGGNISYSLEAGDGVETAGISASAHPAVAVSNAPPALRFTGEPDYVGDGLHPQTGNASTNLTFRVSYSDTDGTDPTFVKVIVNNGTGYSLVKVSGSPSAGAIYSTTLKLPQGNHSYYFTASDGLLAARVPDTFVTFKLDNTAPQLAYTMEPGYGGDGASPDTTNRTEPVTFRIRYQDPDGNDPQVRVHIDGEVTGTPLVKVGGEVATGAIFQYATTSLPRGNHTYYFTASDAIQSTRLPTGTASHQLRVNERPVLAWTGEAGYTADGVQPDQETTNSTFTFRVRYTDLDGNDPEHVSVMINNEAAKPMVRVSGSPATGAIYQISTRLPAGQLTYHFEGSDGFASTRLPGTGENTVTVTKPFWENAVRNPGFESATLDQWTPWPGATVEPCLTEPSSEWAHSGSRSLHIRTIAPREGCAVYQYVKATEGFDYVASAYGKSGSSLAELRLAWHVRGNTTYGPDIIVPFPSDESSPATIAVTAPPGATSARIWLHVPAAQLGTAEAWLDDVSFQARNSAPYLAYEGGSGFESDGAHPNRVNEGNETAFRVVYFDLDGNTPTSINVTIGGTSTALTRLSGGPRWGTVYGLTTLLPPGNHTYFFQATDGLHSTRFPSSGTHLVEVNRAPTLSYLGNGGYKSDGVEPGAANEGTLFTFRVRYVDPDVTPPQHVSVIIDGTAYDMTTSENLTANGATYVRSLLLQGGTQAYHFAASDWNASTRLPATGNLSVRVNRIPTLAYTGETGYTSDGVSPDTANEGSTFTFRVKYTDLDGTPPQHVRLLLDGNTTGVPMTYVSGGVATGAIYQYTTPLTGGNHTYQFTANDSEAAAQLPTASSLSVRVNRIPTLDFTGEAGYAGDGVQPNSGNPGTSFVFRVRYRDTDGTPPSFVRVNVGGTPYPMAWTSGSNASGAIYQSTTTLNTGGNHTYYFEASDSEATTKTPAIGNLTVRVNRLPTLEPPGGPGFETDMISPNTGDVGEMFTFRVKYTDMDGTAPAFVKLHLSGHTPMEMALVGGTPSTGAVYEANATFASGGNRTYRFEASDSEYLVTSPAPGLNYSFRVNTPPTLAFTAEPGFATDGVEPNSANPDQLRTFRVTYRDLDGDTPSYIRVHIDGNTGHALTHVSGTSTAGAIYEYATPVSAGGNHTYHFEAMDGSTAARLPVGSELAFRVNKLPSLSYTGEAGYATDGANPDALNAGGATTFRIRYTDPDGTPPVSLRIVVDSTPSEMTYASGANSTGAIYQTTKTLAGGNHTYYFEANDSEATNRHPATGNLSVRVNRIPTLAYTGETGYTSDGVSPDTANEGSTFTFRVKYTDGDGTPPQHVRFVLDGAPYNMTWVSGSVATGAIYQYTTPLTGGNHTYQFTANDSEAAAQLPTGPPHTIRVNRLPILSYTGETNYATDGVEPNAGVVGAGYIFRITYKDPDGTSPSYVRVVISGSSYNMTWVSGTNATGAIYQNTTYIGTAANHSYRFEANDGEATTRLPATGNLSLRVTRPPTLQYSGGVYSDGVDPNVGNNGTYFGFRVVYHDDDGDWPTNVSAILDGTTYLPMFAITGTPSTSVTYDTSVRINRSGPHNVSFVATDGVAWTYLPLGGPIPFTVNGLPKLEYVNTTGYVGDGVHPNRGNPDTWFDFRVRYYDVEGQAPASIFVRVDGGHVIPLSYNSGNVASGAIYSASVPNFGEGIHTYWFEASDGMATARQPATGNLDFSVNYLPRLAYVNTTGFVTDGADPDAAPPGTAFTFKVSHTDPDNATAPTVFVSIDGDLPGRSMTCGALVSGMRECRYNSSAFAAGSHTYYFHTADEGAFVRYPASGNLSFRVDLPPTLNYTGEAGYVSDGADPDTVLEDAPIKFRVKYTDPEGTYPRYLRVAVDSDKLIQHMDHVEGNIATGAIFETTITLTSGTHTYRFNAHDGVTLVDLPVAGTKSVTVKHRPVLSYTGEPGYTLDGANPTTVNDGETVTFRIAWRDADGPAPTYVRLHLDGSATGETMSLASGAHETGAIYSIAKTLSGGNHTYHFQAANSDATLRIPAQTDHVLPVNRRPSLAYTGVTGYTTDGVEPNAGPSTAPFTFKVRYTDPEGTAPAYVRMKLDGTQERLMTRESGNSTGGAVYVLQESFAAGTQHTYFFETSDGNLTARLPATGNLSFSVNAVPELVFTGESGYATDGVNPDSANESVTFAFRVKYRHLGGNWPWEVVLVVDGRDFGYMDYVSGAPETGAIYELRTRLDPGNHVYRFRTTDGTTTVEHPTTNSLSIQVQEVIANGVPTVTFAGTPGYTFDAAGPDPAGRAGYYNFRILVRDSDDLDGEDGLPKANIHFVNGAKRPLMWDTTPSDAPNGVFMSANYPPQGATQYYFTVTDGKHTVRWPPAGAFDLATETGGPKPPTSPMLRYAYTPGMTTDAAGPATNGKAGYYNFRLHVQDVDDMNGDDSYPHVRVHLVGVMDQPLYWETAASGAPNGLYVSANYPAQGATRYYFTATDGTHTIRWPEIGVFTLTSETAPTANAAPTLGYTGETGFTGDGAGPDPSGGATYYEFRVKYTDADPALSPSGYPQVNVVLNGTTHSLTAACPCNHTLGTVFKAAVPAPSSSATYYFTASDGVVSTRFPANESITLASETPPPAYNSGPSLTWTNEPGYSVDGLEPEAGMTDSMFTFRLKYSDPEGIDPAYVRLHLDGNVTGIPMVKQGGTAKTGAIYAASLKLPFGQSHTYHFEASDGRTTVRLPATGEATGPYVGGLTAGSVTPGSGTSATDFAFKVKYYNRENAVPQSVHVTIDGHPYPMFPEVRSSGWPGWPDLPDTTSMDGINYTFSSRLFTDARPPPPALPGGPHIFSFSAKVGSATYSFPDSGALSGPQVARANLKPTPRLAIWLQENQTAVDEATTGTTFIASAIASGDDSDGDKITYTLDWGDGTTEFVDANDPIRLPYFTHAFRHPGTYIIILTTSDIDGSASLTRSYTVVANALEAGAAERGWLQGTGDMQYYRFHVPAGMKEVRIDLDRADGGSGNFDFYVKRDGTPTTTSFDWSRTTVGTSRESLVITDNPRGTRLVGGWYTILVRSASGTGWFTIEAEANAPEQTDNVFPIDYSGRNEIRPILREDFEDNDYGSATIGQIGSATTNASTTAVGASHEGLRGALVASFGAIGQTSPYSDLNANQLSFNLTEGISEPFAAQVWISVPKGNDARAPGGGFSGLTPDTPVPFRSFRVLSLNTRDPSGVSGHDIDIAFLDNDLMLDVARGDGTWVMDVAAVDPMVWVSVRVTAGDTRWDLYVNDAWKGNFPRDGGEIVSVGPFGDEHATYFGSTTELYNEYGALFIDDLVVTRFDSDTDGLRDKAEMAGFLVTLEDGSVVHRQTDPFRADSDQDGRTDLAEFGVAIGSAPNDLPTCGPQSDPRDPDSDNDGIPDGVETYLKVQTDPLSNNAMGAGWIILDGQPVLASAYVEGSVSAGVGIPFVAGVSTGVKMTTTFTNAGMPVVQSKRFDAFSLGGSTAEVDFSVLQASGSSGGRLMHAEGDAPIEVTLAHFTFGFDPGRGHLSTDIHSHLGLQVQFIRYFPDPSAPSDSGCLRSNG